ncbi:MAG TPA: omptin family outer membrane protease [Treponemataceae bacterium]|nr:omptin family outer membrane protease [Treponemataceae bacterium]
MISIYNKKPYILVAFLLLATTLAMAKENKAFTFTPTTGIISGKVREYVFSEYINSEERMLSRLDWQQYIVPFIGATETIKYHDSFFRLSIVSAIPIRCGRLKDFDFLNETPTVLTHYSQHDLYLDKCFIFSANVGYTFYARTFILAPSLGIKTKSQKWSAYNGYIQYAAEKEPIEGNPTIHEAWTEDVEKFEISGNGISYEQQCLLPFVSLMGGYEISSDWSVFVDLKLFPYLIIDTLDSHYLTPSRQFFDSMKGGSGFEINAKALYNKSAIVIGYEYLSVFNGTSYVGSIGLGSGVVGPTTAKPGTDSSLVKIAFEYSY